MKTNQNDAPQRYCWKCLLTNMPDDSLQEKIRKTIEAIDGNLRTEPEEYERRLKQCKECEKLLDGMCRVCGCFVEVRAAKKKSYCPGIVPRW